MISLSVGVGTHAPGSPPPPRAHERMRTQAWTQRRGAARASHTRGLAAGLERGLGAAGWLGRGGWGSRWEQRAVSSAGTRRPQTPAAGYVRGIGVVGMGAGWGAG